MKILLTGGGTAGHVTPNIAIAPKLIEEGFDISYIGTKDGMERNLIIKEEIPYFYISAGKLRRYFDFKNFTDAFRIAKGFFDASRHIKRIKPDVVFSKGGFVSCPVVWAASLRGIPVIIHESDITPGLANKLSIPFASKVCHAFPTTASYLPKEKAVLAGIPVRENILNGSRAEGLNICGFTKFKQNILVIGGSLGSKSVNSFIRESLGELLVKYQVCHICGANGVDETLNNINGYKQFEYVGGEMAHLYAMADIVISRAGATTIYELLTMNKPNILIPLPKASSRGDQILNANFFKESGFSYVLEEENITKESLMLAIGDVSANRREYINNMRNSDISDSTKTVVDLIKENIKK